MLDMEDPEIITYTERISWEERVQRGAINFAKENYFIGAMVVDYNINRLEVPPEVGSLKARVRKFRWNEEEALGKDEGTSYLALHKCAEVVPNY